MNEDPIAASQDAPPGAQAPSSESPPPPAAPANTRATSRFYSRLARGHKAVAAPAAASASSEPVSLDSLTVEQAVQLKDNLPVRATAAPGTEATEFGGPREDRPPRDGRERRGRGRDRERGGRERGEREGDRDRKFDRDRDRGRDRHRSPENERPADAISPGAESAPATEDQRLAPAAAEQTSSTASATASATEAPRKLRFEDAPPQENQRAVQEFRPSRDRDFHREAERARHERQKRENETAGEAKSPGLFGWMKSIFTSKTDAPASTEPMTDRPRDRDRGPRGHQAGRGQGGGHGGPQGPGGGEGGGRRRRRRRGGRNRNRNREGGHGGGGGAQVGGGD